MITSGTTLLATTSDAPVPVPAIPPGVYKRIIVITTGTASGFVALDGGGNDRSWALVPSSASGGSLSLPGPIAVQGISIKRIPSGSDFTGVQVIAIPQP